MMDHYLAATLVRIETMSERDRRRGDDELGRIVADIARTLSRRAIRTPQTRTTQNRSLQNRSLQTWTAGGKEPRCASSS